MQCQMNDLLPQREVVFAIKVENPSSHHRWNQIYKATAFQPWSQDIPSHLYTAPSDVFRCPFPKTPGTCGLYGCDDLLAQHLAHLERWRTGLSKWLSGNGGIIVRKKWQIHGNPEKNNGLHALNCWTPRLDGFLWIRFGSIWITSSVSDLICCGHESRGPMFGVTPASVACPTDLSLGKLIPTALQRLPVHRGITWTRLSADTKKPNTSLHPCKKI